MDSSDPPNHAITWRVMATIMGLEVIACVGITVAWLLGPFVDIIENFYNVPDCDFSCFRRVSNQLAVIKIVCAILYSASAASALFALYGFLAGRYKYINSHVVMSLVRVITVIFICCYMFHLTYNYHTIFVANWIVLLATLVLNVASAVLVNIGYNLERDRNLEEARTALEPLVRPFSGHYPSYGSFRSKSSKTSLEEPMEEPEPEPDQGEFFQRRPTGFPQAAANTSGASVNASPVTLSHI